MGLFARLLPSTSAFPRFTAGQLLHHPFRGLHSVHSRYGLQTRQVAKATLYTRGFSSFVASTTAPIATGWSEPDPGRDFPRCGPAPFHGAHEIWGYDAYPATRTVDTHIVKLRQKLEDDPADPKYILSIYGEGYKFVG